MHWQEILSLAKDGMFLCYNCSEWSSEEADDKCIFCNHRQRGICVMHLRKYGFHIKRKGKCMMCDKVKPAGYHIAGNIVSE